MQRLVRILVLGVLVFVGACTPMVEPRTAAATVTSVESQAPLRGRRIVLLPPDVRCFELGVGGLATPRADWTEQARRNVTAALQRIVTSRGSELVPWPEQGLAASELEATERFRKLAVSVGKSILLFSDLPTKRGGFDWSLGEAGRTLADVTGADLALHLWAEDSHASPGLVALNILSVAAAVAGGPAVVRTGKQTGFAQLIDLRSGRVLWSNRMIDVGAEADLREEAPAGKSIERLLAGCPA